MSSEEAIEHCHAYLDHQLDPETVARIDACMANDPRLAGAYARERALLAMLKARSASVAKPPKLVEGIKARLAKEHARRAVPIPIRRLSRRGWILALTGAAAAACAAVYLSFSPSECPYMVACASEHDAVLKGQRPMELESTDRAKLATFVATKTRANVTEVPALNAFSLQASGAGTTRFDSLKKFGAPDAAYVIYHGAGNNDSVTLFIHPWAEEEPMPMNMTHYQGRKYFTAVHGKNAVAAWKSDDNSLVISLVTTRSKQETLKMADEARTKLSAQAAQHALLRRTERGKVAWIDTRN